ncbi:olfactory receptor 1020-like [Grus americana]|uniref:olfactory receptor 1020-like n=1 Tax=Grus americana TaxID=9117 RepID=UPI00240820D2|nr:olfactory receptor 1020-like [Grus americana]XP_054657060.1 olfactory receptor 1020-like [Grus americana]
MQRGKWVSQTLLMEFLLLGLGDARELQTPLFLLCLATYTVTMVGKILIIVLVVRDPHLHTPMHFFLMNLSGLKTCYSSTIPPRLLASFLTGDTTISVQGCMAQFFFFGTFATSECYLLAAMSYDRYLAICQPLLYASLMNWKVCLQLVAGSWVAGPLISTGITSFISHQRFCGPSATDHFFCEEAPLLELSCSDTGMIRILIIILSFPDVVFPFLFTLASYVCIIAAVLRIPSSMGRHKAFSTCSSHLTVVIVFYGTLIIVYMLPRTVPLRQLNKTVSLFYTVLTPLINPLIYSLRNREVKEALGRVLRRPAACTDSSNQVWVSGHKSGSPAN